MPRPEFMSAYAGRIVGDEDLAMFTPLIALADPVLQPPPEENKQSGAERSVANKISPISC